MESSVLEKSQVATLTLLTLSFMVGEVAHFLPTVTSKALANSIGFGDMACYSNVTEDPQTTALCSGFKTQEGCGEQFGCMWMYSGEGWEYQVLAGPAFIITFTISGVLMGFLADRVSRPRLLGACVALFSSCCALIGFATQYWQLVVLRMGIALGEGACRPAGTALIAEMFESRHRGVANGIFSWGVYFGYGFSFIFGIYVTQLDLFGQGWRATYVLAGAPGLLLAILLSLADEPRNKSFSSSKKKLEALGKSVEGVQWQRDSYLWKVVTALRQPGMLLLFLAASIRHTAGYAWAHNNVPYFSNYHQGKEIGYWLTVCTIGGGSVGVVGGGYLSDLAVTRLGLHSRLWLLSICTLMATPFAILTLYLQPPHAFATLFAYYFFAETWFSLLFTVVVEIVPPAIRSGCVGTFLFLMNNVGGNLPMLVDPLTKVQGLGLHSTLYIMWPGLLAASGALFLVASLPLWRESRDRETRPRKLSLD